LIVTKDLLALVATDNDMVKGPSNFISQYLGRGQTHCDYPSSNLTMREV